MYVICQVIGERLLNARPHVLPGDKGTLSLTDHRSPPIMKTRNVFLLAASSLATSVAAWGVAGEWAARYPLTPRLAKRLG
jgi:hypothetical protein